MNRISIFTQVKFGEPNRVQNDLYSATINVGGDGREPLEFSVSSTKNNDQIVINFSDGEMWSRYCL